MNDRERLFDLIQHWRLLINDETYENGAVIDAFDSVIGEDAEDDNVLTRVWRNLFSDEHLTDDDVIAEFNDTVAIVAEELNDDNE